jgi:hypothetical protein
MAKESGREQSADDLKLEIARSRDRITQDLRVFRRELAIPRKIKRSFQRQTGAWVTAAVVVGTILILLPARRKIIRVEPEVAIKRKDSKKKLLETGFALTALKFAITLLRPAITSYLTKKVQGFATGVRAEPHRAKSRSWF